MILVFPIILVLIIVITFLVAIGLYNKLIRGRNRIKNAWAQIDVQLKRRYDLIPNLVETVKGYASHEKETFTNITEARSRAMKAGNVGDKAVAEAQLDNALSKFMLVVENYPQLQANQNFIALQEELTSTENRISFARQNYNDQVYFYNNNIETFPSNIIAGMFNFAKEEPFEIQNSKEKETPKVKF